MQPLTLKPDLGWILLGETSIENIICIRSINVISFMIRICNFHEVIIFLNYESVFSNKIRKQVYETAKRYDL